MKKLLSFLVAAAVMAPFAARAQVISVQFNASTVTSSETAGVIPESIWNYDTTDSTYVAAGGTSNYLNLKDSTGATTTVSENTVSDGHYPSYGGMAFSNPGDAALFKTDGYLAGYSDPAVPFTLNLTGLNPSLTYNLVLYVEATNLSSELLSASEGSTTYYFDTAPATTSSYLEATATVSAGATVANCVEFTDLTGSTTQTATILTHSNDFNVCGFQLQVVPEPSTYAMLLGGIGVLLVARRFRQSYSL